jgi:hypothetical protein
VGRIHPNNDAFRALQLVARSRGIDGHSNLFALTGNYRLGLQGPVFGAYLIAGGGMYYPLQALARGHRRRWDRLQSRLALVGIHLPIRVRFRGPDQTLFSAGSTAFGGNGGVGFTIRINQESYKFYFESCYHYAPNKNISTQIIPITFGFSW